MTRRMNKTSSPASPLSRLSLTPSEGLRRTGNHAPYRFGFATGVSLLAALLITGCTTPIGADHRTARIAHKQVAASALDHELSPTARLVLHRYSMTALY